MKKLMRFLKDEDGINKKDGLINKKQKGGTK